MIIDTDQYVEAKRGADIIGVSLQNFYLYAKTGRLPPPLNSTISRKLWKVDDLKNWVKPPRQYIRKKVNTEMNGHAHD